MGSLQAVSELIQEEALHNSKSGNGMWSAYNVSECFALLAEGTAGPPQEKMQQFFGITTTNIRKDYPAEIQSANGVFCQGVKPSFVEAVKGTHNAFVSGEVKAEAINNFVSEATHGVIKEIVERVPPDTLAVLVSALYFKGTWETAFDPALTMPFPFEFNVNSKKDVPMMSQEKLKCQVLHTADARYLALDYVGGEVKFVVEMSGLELTKTSWENVLAATQAPYADVDVRLPKFKVETNIDLLPILEKKGGLQFLGNPPDGTFSPMTSEPVKITQVLHKCFMEVDEKGTVAAAAAAAVMARCLVVGSRPIFYVDGPFLCHVVVPSLNAVLFSACITDPTL
jgi:serpin B